MITKKTTLLELAGLVTAGLTKRKIKAVLVGGAVVSIYSNNEYQSKDLDFISPADHSEIIKAMKELGFERHGRNFFHSRTDFTIEFPTGPIAIGDTIPVKPEGEVQTSHGKITLFSPTQCVMDRLTWFYHNNDRQALDQALAVGTIHPINISKIKRWSESEKSEVKFKIFLDKLKIAIEKK